LNKKLVATIAVAFTSLTGLVMMASPARAAEVIRLTIGAGHPLAGSSWVQTLPEVVIPKIDSALARTGKYKIEWTQAYGGAIAKLGNVLESVEDGILDLGVINYPFEAAKLFPHNFSYKLPFGTCNPDLMLQVSTKLHDRFHQLKTVFEEKYNQKWLAVGASNCYGMIAKFPWKGFSDLKGRKIGAAGPNLPWVSAAGAVGVATTLNLAYTSLQTGVYEALIIFIDPVGGFKLYEPARHWIQVGFGSVTPITLTVNLKRFKALPKDVQDAILEGAREYGPGMVRISKASAEKVADLFKKSGVELHEVRAEERAAWAAAMPNIPNDFARDAVSKGYPYVPDLMRALIQELEAAGAKQPRQWKIE
jgi:TRAP-type C4-dicarboxylate transport system substrate-binding protein